MIQQEKEKMFLDLNSVLVKFWKEQGRPDKEIKIELLERMLDWYKKMGTITLDKQSKEPVNEDLEDATENYIAPIENDEGLDYINFNGRDIKDAFIAGAEWQKEQMLKDAVEGEIIEDLHGQRYVKSEAVDGTKFKFGERVKIVIIPEKED